MPILLWDATPTTTADDAGVQVIKSILPPVPPPALYRLPQLHTFSHVPPLSFFCIYALIPYPDQVHATPARIAYQRPSKSRPVDVLSCLIPALNDESVSDATLIASVDPRLWAVIAQIYTNIPPRLQSYRLPLWDPHLPDLQRVPSTAQFCFITILDLASCPQLSDDTIVELKPLHTLCALDVTRTRLSAHGINVLGRTIRVSEQEEPTGKGPWGLRILSLRECRGVNDKIHEYLPKFSLLSVVDLRGTKCTSAGASRADYFRPSANKALYFPNPFLASLDVLSTLTTGALFTSHNPCTIHVDFLRHDSVTSLPKHRQHHLAPVVAMQDAYAIIPPNPNLKQEKGQPDQRAGVRNLILQNSQRIQVGNTQKLFRKEQQKREEEQSELNKEDWYKRNKIHRSHIGHHDDHGSWPSVVTRVYSSTRDTMDDRGEDDSTENKKVSDDDENSDHNEEDRDSLLERAYKTGMKHRPRLNVPQTSRTNISNFDTFTAVHNRSNLSIRIEAAVEIPLANTIPIEATEATVPKAVQHLSALARRSINLSDVVDDSLDTTDSSRGNLNRSITRASSTASTRRIGGGSNASSRVTKGDETQSHKRMRTSYISNSGETSHEGRHHHEWRTLALHPLDAACGSNNANGSRPSIEHGHARLEPLQGDQGAYRAATSGRRMWTLTTDRISMDHTSPSVAEPQTPPTPRSVTPNEIPRRVAATPVGQSFYASTPRTSITQATYYPDKDDHLMLYRDPPPWHTGVATHIRTKPNPRPPEGEVAVLKQQNEMGRAGLRALVDMATQRNKGTKKIPQSLAHDRASSDLTGHCPNSKPVEPKNPFRWKLPDGTAAAVGETEANHGKPVTVSKPQPQSMTSNNLRDAGASNESNQRMGFRAKTVHTHKSLGNAFRADAPMKRSGFRPIALKKEGHTSMDVVWLE